VCDLETSRMGAPYIYDISRLRVNIHRSVHRNIVLYYNKQDAPVNSNYLFL